jgi:hypothetical protein
MAPENAPAKRTVNLSVREDQLKEARARGRSLSFMRSDPSS